MSQKIERLFVVTYYKENAFTADPNKVIYKTTQAGESKNKIGVLLVDTERPQQNPGPDYIYVREVTFESFCCEDYESKFLLNNFLGEDHKLTKSCSDKCFCYRVYNPILEELSYPCVVKKGLNGKTYLYVREENLAEFSKFLDTWKTCIPKLDCVVGVPPENECIATIDGLASGNEKLVTGVRDLDVCPTADGNSFYLWDVSELVPDGRQCVAGKGKQFSMAILRYLR